jgi:hypothetical protein
MRDLRKLHNHQLPGPESSYMFRLVAIWTYNGCEKYEMRAEFWIENPKGFFEERGRASLQDNFKSYLMGVALK